MIVYLHGASGSGKTCIAVQLQEQLDGTYLHFGLDTIWHGMPRKLLARLARGEELSDVKCPSVGRSYVKCVEALAGLGHDLIIDDDLPDDVVRDHVLPILRPYPMVLVGVQCPLAELLRRETARGDRPRGSAKRGYEGIHRHLQYDLAVDSSKETPVELARRIAEFVKRGNRSPGLS